MRLTAGEIRVVVFLLLALVVGALVKNYRDQRRLSLPPPAKVTPLPQAAFDRE